MLSHWHSESRRAQVWATMPREDIIGLYDVGPRTKDLTGASFDITELDDARPLADDGEPAYGLEFTLGDGVRLIVVWGAD